MNFMLVSHGPNHLRLASDAGHRFMFHVIRDGRDGLVAVEAVEWAFGRLPDNSSNLIADASRFASVCAEDFGLL